MRVDHAERLRLLAQMDQNAREHRVLDHIGEIAGMECVHIVHPKRLSLLTFCQPMMGPITENSYMEMKTTNADEAQYLATVKEGKAIVASISGKQWALGDLADKVETQYGKNRLAQFAEDINFDGAVSTLERCRDVCRACPDGRGRPRYFASAQLLATHPDRFEIVKGNPDISQAEAREITRQWREEQTKHLLSNQLKQANDIISVAATRKKCTPEERRLLGKAAAAAPEILEIMDKAGDEWLNYVRWLSEAEDEAAKTAKGDTKSERTA
jgi:hypothetical protein